MCCTGTYSCGLFRGISLRRFDSSGNEIKRYDMLFDKFKVQKTNDGGFEDNDPVRFGRRVHYYSAIDENCPIFKHSADVLDALKSNQRELIFKINPLEDGIELRRAVFEELSFDEFIRLGRPKQDMIEVGVYTKAVDQDVVTARPGPMPSIDDFDY